MNTVLTSCVARRSLAASQLACSFHFHLAHNLFPFDIDIRTTDQRVSTPACARSIMDPICPDLSGFEELDEYIEEENLVDFDPFLRFIAASGEVNFEYPDLPALPDISMATTNMPASTVGNAAAYTTAKTSRPLTLTSLPHDVRTRIYAMSLSPQTEVAIRSFVGLPYVYESIDSPINLFLVSRKVYREAVAVFYGGTTFHLEHEWGIGYMTGHMGLNNCKEIRNFTTFMQYVWNIPLTIRTVFPKLENLAVLPNQDWYNGPWFDLLHKKHDGYYQGAIDEAVVTPQAKAAFGLRELLDMSRHYLVIMTLPFWNNRDTTHRPVVSVPMQQCFVYVC
jgi:hypothetical protein